jgi:hypothetical protein
MRNGRRKEDEEWTDGRRRDETMMLITIMKREDEIKIASAKAD